MELAEKPLYLEITKLPRLSKNTILSIDFETIPETYTPDIISFYWAEGSGIIDFKKSGKEAYELVFEMLDSVGCVLAHNTSFELSVLKTMGYDIRKLYKKIHDTMLMLHCLNTENELGLKHHGNTVGMDLALDWKTAHKLSRDEYIKYCQDDSEACYKLASHLLPQLKDAKVEIPYQMELEMIWVILAMKDNGILVDRNYLQELQTDTEEKLKVVKKTLIEIAGKIINFKSGKQLSEILFKDLGAKLLPEYKTEKGNVSVKETIIVDIKKRSTNPKVTSFCENLLVFKELSKFRDAFLSDKFFSLIHPDGRMRPDFWSTGTATSRFCVAGDTLLETSMGRVEISEINLANKQQVSIMSHRGRLRPIVNLFYKGLDNLYTVTTRSGKSITCTMNHRFLTPTGWVSLKDIKDGRMYTYDNQIRCSIEEGLRRNIRRGIVQENNVGTGFNQGRDCAQIQCSYEPSKLYCRVLQSLSSLCRSIKNKTQEVFRSCIKRKQEWRTSTRYDYTKRSVAATDRTRLQDLEDCLQSKHKSVFSTTEHRVLWDRSSKDSSPKTSTLQCTGAGTFIDFLPFFSRRCEELLFRSSYVLRFLAQNISGTYTHALVYKGSSFWSQILQNCEQNSERSHLLEYKSLRNNSFFGSTREGNTSPTWGASIRQILNGFLFSGKEIDSGSRWRISSKRQEDSGARQEEESKSIGVRLYDPSFYGERSHKEYDEGSGRYCVDFIDSIVFKEFGDVWDIEVEEDHSYEAHGFVNHNSNSKPNIQQTPSQGDGARIRKAYIADKGNVLICADLSQAEYRILAHYSGDEDLIKAYAEGTLDIHDIVSKEVDIPRFQAKILNFSLVYGAGAGKVADMLNITPSEATSFIAKYFKRFPGIKNYLLESVNYAKAHGKIRLLSGRIRDISKYDFIDNMAKNTPIQGAVAEYIKLCMIALHKKFLGSNIKMLIQVHDELLFECPEEQAEEACKIIQDVMENVHKLSVPMKATPKIAKNWYEAK